MKADTDILVVDSTLFSGLNAILSGPAGGVVGYARTCFDPADPTPVIGFDMGGTVSAASLRRIRL